MQFFFLDQNNQAEIYNANFSQATENRDSDREILGYVSFFWYWIRELQRVLFNKNILNMLISLIPFYIFIFIFLLLLLSACSVLILKTCICENTKKKILAPRHLHSVFYFIALWYTTLVFIKWIFILIKKK